MAVRLRLMRMGKKKQPTYRIVAADSRSPRDGRFLQIIGTYNPRSEPSTLRVDNAAALEWLQQGARPSEAVEKLLKISGVWESYTTGAPLPVEADEQPDDEQPDVAAVQPGGTEATTPDVQATAGGGEHDTAAADTGEGEDPS